MEGHFSLNQKKLGLVFVGILTVALVLRFLVFDLVLISNFDLFPKFQAGEMLLVSRLSSPKPGQWVLLKNHPVATNYSVRRLGDKLESGEWVVEMPTSSSSARESSAVTSSQIVGRVVMTLWAWPCRNQTELCSQSSYKILTFTN